VRERDRGGFVGAHAPRGGVRWSEARIREAVANELAPDVSGAVGPTAAVNVREMIVDADFDEADPLGDLGARVVAVGRYGEFGVDLRPRGFDWSASEQQAEGAICSFSSDTL
jgi:hypothetical protein